MVERPVYVTDAPAFERQELRAMREVSCPHCGYFLARIDAPWGKVRAYCRGCRQYRTAYLGRPTLTEIQAGM